MHGILNNHNSYKFYRIWLGLKQKFTDLEFYDYLSKIEFIKSSDEFIKSSAIASTPNLDMKITNTTTPNIHVLEITIMIIKYKKDYWLGCRPRTTKKVSHLVKTTIYNSKDLLYIKIILF